MLLSQFLHEVGILQNVRHGLRHHLTAGLVVGHLLGSVLCLFLLDQAVNILATLGESIEHNLSEFIVPHRVPLFNEVGKFVGKGAQHGIFGYLSGILGVGQTSVHIDVDGVVAPSELALGAFISPGLSGFTLVQNNVNAGDLCHGTQVLIGSALGVVEGLLQIRDRHALALDSALLVAGLSVDCSLVLGLLLISRSVGCVLACLVGKLTLSIGQIGGGFAVLCIGKGNAALAHIVGCLVCLVVLGYILPLLVGVDHRLGLGAVLLGCIFQRNSLRNFRGFLGSCFGLTNLLVTCYGSISLGFNRSVFLNSCRFGLCSHRLRRLHRFRSLGGNLLVGNFCAFLGLLSGFQYTAISLGIDSVGVDALCPAGSIATGLNILSVQLIGNPLAVSAARHSLLLCSGQLLTRCLLGKGRCHSFDVLHLTQLGQSMGSRRLNGLHILRRHSCLVLVHQFAELTTAEILAAVQAFLHLLGVGVLRVDLQSLAHQILLKVAVILLCIPVAVEVADGVADAAHAHAHQSAAGTSLDYLLECISPCSVFQFFPGVVGKFTVDQSVIGDVRQFRQGLLGGIYQHGLAQVLDDVLNAVRGHLFELLEVADGYALKQTLEHAGYQTVPESLTVAHAPVKGVVGSLCCCGQTQDRTAPAAKGRSSDGIHTGHGSAVQEVKCIPVADLPVNLLGHRAAHCVCHQGCLVGAQMGVSALELLCAIGQNIANVLKTGAQGSTHGQRRGKHRMFRSGL